MRWILVVNLHHVRALEILLGHGFDHGKVYDIKAVVMESHSRIGSIGTDGLNPKHNVILVGYVLSYQFPWNGVGKFLCALDDVGIYGSHFEDLFPFDIVLAVKELDLVVERQCVRLLGNAAQMPHLVPGNGNITATQELARAIIGEGRRYQFGITEIVQALVVCTVLNSRQAPQDHGVYLGLYRILLFLFLFLFLLLFFLFLRCGVGRFRSLVLYLLFGSLEFEYTVCALSLILQHHIVQEAGILLLGSNLRHRLLVVIELVGDDVYRDDTHVGHQVRNLIHHGIAVHGHIGLLAFKQFHHPEVVDIVGELGTAGYSGHGPCELSIEDIHLGNVVLVKGCNHRCEELWSLCLVAYGEGT